MDQEPTKRLDDDGIRIRDLLADMRRSKIMVVCIIAGLTLAGVCSGLLFDRQYEASTVLSPVIEEGGSGRLGGLSALASQYGGLASLAGINIPGGSKKDEGIATLQSELLTEQYIRDNDLLPILYSERWDTAARHWKSTNSKIPTVWQANRMFKNQIRQITDEKKTGLILLSIRWKEPKLAAKWANDLVSIANSYLRNKAIREAQRNITYLNDQASKTNVVEVQKAIYSLLEQEINKEMLARGREEYALKVIDPAFAPEKPSSPGPLMLGFLGFAFGCLMSLLIVFGRRVMLA